LLQAESHATVIRVMPRRDTRFIILNPLIG
jgi:hypothetical protein